MALAHYTIWGGDLLGRCTSSSYKTQAQNREHTSWSSANTLHKGGRSLETVGTCTEIGGGNTEEMYPMLSWERMREVRTAPVHAQCSRALSNTRMSTPQPEPQRDSSTSPLPSTTASVHFVQQKGKNGRRKCILE
eukprot:scaffold147219_cov19-Tisochrysis_lutea.AAC.2